MKITGYGLLGWAENGMNWGEGPRKSQLRAAAALLRQRGDQFAAEFGRAARGAAECGSVWTQTEVSEAVFACARGESPVEAWRLAMIEEER